MRKILIISIIASFVAVLSFLPNASATSYDISPGSINPDCGTNPNQGGCYCIAIGGIWDNVSTCTLDSDLGLGSGNFITVEPNAELIVESGTTLTFSSIVTIYGTMTNDGTIDINSGGDLISISKNSACGTITNSGMITSSSGTIQNSCTFTNTGTITNSGGVNPAFIYAAGGTFTNHGTIDNQPNGAIQVLNNQAGTLTNSGTISNGGFLQLYAGDTVIFNGPSGFSGSFTNTGTLNMNSGGTLTVGFGGASPLPTILEIKSGTLTIPSGVTLYVSNSGTVKVDSGAIVADSGFITTQDGPDGSNNPGGAITNFGTINDNPGGTINNNCDFFNGGVCTILNNFGGTVSNPLSGTITNNAGGTITNNANSAITNAGTITNTGTITNAGGTITNNAGTIANPLGGNIVNNNIITNAGTITNNAAATITNNKQITNNGGATITNNNQITNNAGATITNIGTIANKAGATVTNSGTVTTNAGSTITNDNQIINNNIITNSGTITNNNQITNNAAATITNSKTITNSPTGTITNNNQITNNMGATITNNHQITNNGAGTFTNSGTIENNSGGIITNNHQMINNSGGTITNSGIITNITGNMIINSGTITNNSDGIINNNSNGGTVTTLNNKKTIDNDGKINNDGTIENNSGGTITNKSGGTITDNHGDIHNFSGTITNNSGGTITNHGGCHILNPLGSTIENSGILNNNGIIINLGSFNNNSGATINNNSGGVTDSGGGIIYNYSGGFISDSGSIINDDGLVADNGNPAAIVNSKGGTITIFSGGSITNNQSGIIRNNGDGLFGSPVGTIKLSGGTITNKGRIINEGGLIINSGAISNLAGGYLININQGITIPSTSRKSSVTTQNNIGTINNAGTLTNSGTIYNGAGSKINNNAGGTITNNPSSTISNFGIITNSGISFTNSGTVGNVCGGTFVGTISGNAAVIQPCPRTTSTTVTPSILSARIGDIVTYTAIVADTDSGTQTTPTGSVSWSDGTALGTFSTANSCILSSGACQISYTPPSTGPVIITATYLGDSTHGTSFGTSTLTVTPHLPPATPTDILASTTSSSSITISWTASTGATGYNIFRSKLPAGPFTTQVGAPTTSPFIDLGLLSGTPYYYELTASNSTGSSALSATVTATTLPVIPTGASAIATASNSILVTWTASTGATVYNVYRDTTAAFTSPTLVGSPTTNSFTDTGLSPTTQYYYEISALDIGGASALSTPAVTATTLVAPPSAPTGVSAIVQSSSSIKISWSPSTGATVYTIYRATSSSGPFTAPVHKVSMAVYNTVNSAKMPSPGPLNTITSAPIGKQTGVVLTTFTDTGLVPNTTYYYKIRASNAGGASVFSSPAASVSTLPLPPPAPMGVTAVTLSTTSIKVSWTASPTAAVYSIFRSSSPTGPFDTQVGTSTISPFIDTGLSSGTKYYYQVSASNAGGVSLDSITASATTKPDTPTGLAVTNPTTSTTISLTWTGSTGATSYKVYRSGSPSGPFTTSVGTSMVSSFTNTGLTPNTTYYYEISALDAGGESALSSSTGAITAPAVPTHVIVVTVSSTAITVSWTASPGALSYNVYRSTLSTGPFTVPIASPTSSPFVNIGLSPNTKYFYEINSVNEGGSSVPSTPAVSATTAAAAPRGVTATLVTPTSIKVTWTASPGATIYKIYRDTTPTGPFTTLVGTSMVASFTNTGLPSGTQFYYKVLTSNSAGQSPLSNPAATATTP